MTNGPLSILPVGGIGEIGPGDLIADAIASATALDNGDVVVVASKIVSKAESRVVPCGDSAEEFSEVVAGESVRVLRRVGQMVIAETRNGFVCTNAGVSRSHVPGNGVALLPVDPDRSARRIRDGLERTSGRSVAVVITARFERPFRNGSIACAIGTAGIAAVEPSGSVAVAIADEIAAAADLVARSHDRVPAVVVRGVPSTWFRRSSVHDEIVRSANDELFR